MAVLRAVTLLPAMLGALGPAHQLAARAFGGAHPEGPSRTAGRAGRGASAAIRGRRWSPARDPPRPGDPGAPAGPRAQTEPAQCRPEHRPPGLRHRHQRLRRGHERTAAHGRAVRLRPSPTKPTPRSSSSRQLQEAAAIRAGEGGGRDPQQAKQQASSRPRNRRSNSPPRSSSSPPRERSAPWKLNDIATPGESVAPRPRRPGGRRFTVIATTRPRRPDRGSRETCATTWCRRPRRNEPAGDVGGQTAGYIDLAEQIAPSCRS